LIDLNEKNGSNSYYSTNLSAHLLEAVDKFLISKNISELNTRVVMVGEEIHVLVASGDESVTELGEIENHKVKLVFGDFAPFLKSVIKHLE
jgi:dipeptidyl-peptidase-3